MNELQEKVVNLEEKVDKLYKLEWSTDIRESVRRLVRYLRHIRMIGTIDEFIDEVKHGEHSITLTSLEIDKLIDYQDDLQDYLSSYAQQDFTNQTINKIPKG